jgi:hypothetical protein
MIAVKAAAQEGSGNDAFYVHLLDGRVDVVTRARELRLTTMEAVFLHERFGVTRLPRADIYFVTRQACCPPVMF